MPASPVDPSRLLQDPELLAAVIPGDALFGLLTRSFDLPPLWAAWVAYDDGSHAVCAPGSAISGDAVEEVMLVRTASTPVEVVVTGASRDHFNCTARVTVTLTITAERTDLGALRRTLVAGGRLTRADLQRHLGPAVEAGIGDYLGHHDAATAVATPDYTVVQQHVDDALRGPLFEYGLSGGEVLTMTVDAPGFEADRLRHADLDRARTAQAAGARIERALRQARDEHVAHLATMLEQLQDLARQSPHADIPELIRTFDAGQRAEIYTSLWDREPAAPTTTIAVVAGHQLALYTPDNLGRPRDVVALPGPLGALRSVSATALDDGRPALLVGTALGGHLVDVDAKRISASYAPDPELNTAVRGGFNALTLAGDHVFGTHSELGVVRWPRSGGPGTVILADATRGATAIRHIHADSATLWLSIDDRVLAVPIDAACAATAPRYTPFLGAGANLSALTCTADWILGGTTTGRVLRWTPATPETPEVLFEGQRRPVESIVHLGIAGVQRVFFTDTSTAVQALVLGDAFTCQYRAGGQTLKRVEVASDWVVATNETRDRLLCWPVADPTAKPTTVLVAQALGNSIQDVCLIQG